MMLETKPRQFPAVCGRQDFLRTTIFSQAGKMAQLPKHLSGDQTAINEFLDKFDVR
jgi:hypothetical protein